MAKPIIAFDMDDVLVDSTEYWRVEINKRTGLTLTTGHWKEPGEYSGYYTRVWERHGIGEVFSVEDIDEQMVRDQSGMRPLPKAVEVLQKLHTRFTLVVVTARNSDQRAATQKWLDTTYPSIFEAVIFGNGSQGLALKNKGQICKEVGAGWLVDDNPGHCRDALACGVTPVLFGEYGWHVDVPDDMQHCKSWEDIEAYFAAR